MTSALGGLFGGLAGKGASMVAPAPVPVAPAAPSNADAEAERQRAANEAQANAKSRGRASTVSAGGRSVLESRTGRASADLLGG